MEHVRDLYPRRNQANGRAKVIGRTHDSVCIGRDAYSKEVVSPAPITAANALSCHLTFLSYCEGYVRELPVGHKWCMPEPTSGGAWNSEKTCWLQMLF